MPHTLHSFNGKPQASVKQPIRRRLRLAVKLTDACGLPLNELVTVEMLECVHNVASVLPFLLRAAPP